MELSRSPDVVGTTAGSPTREHNVNSCAGGGLGDGLRLASTSEYRET